MNMFKGKGNIARKVGRDQVFREFGIVEGILALSCEYCVPMEVLLLAAGVRC